MTAYRYDIGLNDKYTFGTEIEFTGVNLERLISILKNKNLPIRYELNHKWGLPKYDIWYLDEDCTVTKDVLGCAIGGELSSRIFTDTFTTWQEIKKVCETLNEANATVSPVCSNHIRVCLSSIKNKPQFFEIFTKLIAIMEEEINLFFMGDDYLIRETKANYARNLRCHLLDFINTVDFQNPEDYFFEMRKARSGLLLFTNRDAINLNDFYDKQLMEIRYPNGTLNPKTIQNNINFILKLIDAIDRGIFASKEVSSIVEKIAQSDWVVDHLNHRNNPGSFEGLTRMISTSEEDVNDFMTQYEQVLSKKPPQR